MSKMTKNEYQKYMRECASKLYTVPGYTMDDYHRELDAVEILPLDLKRFNLDPETEKWINILFTHEDEDRNGNYMLLGFTQNDGIEIAKLDLLYGDYANAYSYYAYNDKEMLLFTYCEGDTTLTLFETTKAYAKAKQESQKWYEEQYA